MKERPNKHIGLPLSPANQTLLERAKAILGQKDISSSERQVRLEIVRAVMTGTVIRPSDDSPEMRNPAYWILENDCFVVAPGIKPVEAIEDLWTLHGADGTPVPRIRCLKYTTLIMIKGIVQYFRATGNTDGIDAMNQFLGHKVIPDELPSKGYDILWKRHYETDRLLPGDQVWFDNPFLNVDVNYSASSSNTKPSIQEKLLMLQLSVQNFAQNPSLRERKAAMLFI